MSFSRIAVLGFTGVAAAVALAVAGVDWLDTGTARPPATVDSRFAPRPPAAERAIERPPVDESARRDLTSNGDVLSLVRAAHTRKVAMEAGNSHRFRASGRGRTDILQLTQNDPNKGASARGACLRNRCIHRLGSSGNSRNHRFAQRTRCIRLVVLPCR